jgi:phage terminase small subunit
MPRAKPSKTTGKPMETRGRPPASVNQPLTRKQELFVKELVSKDGQITLRDAAINAGYSVSSAHTRAYELTNPHISPHVVAAIQSYRRELDEKYGITYQRHIRDLQVIRDMALQNGAYSAAVQAEYRRGQAQGDIYVSKSEIRHGSIDSMSKEDVLKALEEIKNSYAPITIDITAEEKDNTGNRGKARGRLLQASEGSNAEDAEEVELDAD